MRNRMSSSERARIMTARAPTGHARRRYPASGPTPHRPRHRSLHRARSVAPSSPVKSFVRGSDDPSRHALPSTVEPFVHVPDNAGGHAPDVALAIGHRIVAPLAPAQLPRMELVIGPVH